MNSLIYLIDTAYDIFVLLLLIRAVISWIAPGFSNPGWRRILRFLYQVTEPVLSPIRNLLPTTNWGIDLSPLIALFLLFLARQFLIGFLTNLSRDLGLFKLFLTGI